MTVVKTDYFIPPIQTDNIQYYIIVYTFYFFSGDYTNQMQLSYPAKIYNVGI